MPPLRPDQAAALPEALLLDTVASCEAGARELRVLVADDRDRAPLAALLPGIACDLQRGRGLADALRLAIADHVAAGPVAIVVVRRARPAAGALHRACDALAAGADVVLGPALDGGYWLIAMRAAHDAPFDEIPWSTPAVLGDHASALRRRRGCEVALLEPWRDVDTYADLTALAAEVDATLAPRTARVLRELAAQAARSARSRARRWCRASCSRSRRGAPWSSTSSAGRTAPRRPTPTSPCRARSSSCPSPRDGELVLVRQYRHPVRDWTLEVPAGSRPGGRVGARGGGARAPGGGRRHAPRLAPPLDVLLLERPSSACAPTRSWPPA